MVIYLVIGSVAACVGVLVSVFSRIRPADLNSARRTAAQLFRRGAGQGPIIKEGKTSPKSRNQSPCETGGRRP